MADAVNPFTEIYTKLIQALREFDWAAARTQAQAHADLLAEADSLHATTPAVLKELLDSRVYEGVMTVADAALAVAPEQRLVRKQYAQALIDRGRIMPALDIYTKLADDLAGPLADGSETVDKELAEVCGGVGRCNKQLFLLTTDAARRSEYLSRSYSAYKHQFLNNQTRFWHGINAAAVLNFAETNGVAVAGLSDIGATKKDLAAVALAQAKEVLDAWAMATASEACVALGETEAALEWAAMFATNPDTKPFMIAAYLRQLDDMWGVKPDSLLGTTLIPLLREALVKKSGGAVIITGDDVSAERLDSLGDGSESLKMLEKVFGTDSFRPLKWWRTGLHTCRSVVRIDDDNGQPVGTGFLVDGRSLHPNWPDRVVVSNSHVIPDVLRRDDAVVAFHGLDADDVGQKEFRVDDMLWQSPLGDLDTVVLTLAGRPENVDPVQLVDEVSIGQDDRAYIIGHPLGLEQPQFSVQDNAILGFNERRLHYRSPTEGGSSGSPVFNDKWKVIGLHRAGSLKRSKINGGGTYQANEGLRIDAIRKAIQANPAGDKLPE